MSHYTIHQDDDTSKPVHEYRWSLLKDGKPVAEIFTHADAETIRAALNGWQPIETAPKDGTEVLTFEDVFDCCDIAWRDGDGPWCADTGDEISPTHWMPLPRPPRAAASTLPREPFTEAKVSGPRENICAAHSVDWCEVCMTDAAFQHTRQRRK